MNNIQNPAAALSESSISNMPKPNLGVTEIADSALTTGKPDPLSSISSVDEIEELERRLQARKKLLGGGTNLEASPPVNLLRVDLACGRSHEVHATKDPNCLLCQGYEGADIADIRGIKYPKTNLYKFPWPWEDNSVDEFHCSHFVEHIPKCYVEKDGSFSLVPTTHESQELAFKFFDEAYRCLKPDGVMRIIVPAGNSNRSKQDPTHRRDIVPEWFGYLSAEFRKVNFLDHYNVRCNFAIDVGHTVPTDEQLYHPEASARRHRHYNNVVFDHVAVMKAIKTPEKQP